MGSRPEICRGGLHRRRGGHARDKDGSRFQLLFQCNVEHVVHDVDETNGHLLLDIGGDIFQILFVIPRKDNRPVTRAVSGQQLFLHPTDGQHLSAQAISPS